MDHNRPSYMQGVGIRRGIADPAGSANRKVDLPSLGQTSTSQQQAVQLRTFSNPTPTLHQIHQMYDTLPGNPNRNLEARRSQEVMCPPLTTQGRGITHNVRIQTAPIPAQHNNPSPAVHLTAMQGILQDANASSGLQHMPSLITQMAFPPGPYAPLSSPNAMLLPNPANNLAIPMLTSQSGQQGNQVFRNNVEYRYAPSHQNFNVMPVNCLQQNNTVAGNMALPAQPAHLMQLQPTDIPVSQQLHGGAMMVNNAMSGFHTTGLASPSYVVPPVNGHQMILVPYQNTMMAVPSGSISKNMTTVPQPVQSVNTMPQFHEFRLQDTPPNIASLCHAPIQSVAQSVPQIEQTIGISPQGNMNQTTSANQSTVITPSRLAPNVLREPMNCSERTHLIPQSQPVTTSYDNEQHLAFPMASQHGITGLVQQRQPATVPLFASRLHEDAHHAVKNVNMPGDSDGAHTMPENSESARRAQIDNQANSSSRQRENFGVRSASNSDLSFSILDIDQARSQSIPSDDLLLSLSTMQPLDQPSNQRRVNSPQPSRSLPASSNSIVGQPTINQRRQQVLSDVEKVFGLPQLMSEEDIPGFIEDISNMEPVDPPPHEKEAAKTCTQTEGSPRSPSIPGSNQNLILEDILVDQSQVCNDSMNTRLRDRVVRTTEIDDMPSCNPDHSVITSPRTSTSVVVADVNISTPSTKKKASFNSVPRGSKDHDTQHQQNGELFPLDSNGVPDGTEGREVTRTENRSQDLNSMPRNQPHGNGFSSVSGSEDKQSDLDISSALGTARETQEQECQSKSKLVAEAWDAYYDYDWAGMNKSERRKRRMYLINRKRLPTSERKVVKSTRNGDQPVCFRRFTDDEIVEISKLCPRTSRQKKGKKVRNRIIAQRGREQKKQTTEKLEKENEKLRSQNSYLRAHIANLRRASADNAKLRECLDHLVRSSPSIRSNPSIQSNTTIMSNPSVLLSPGTAENSKGVDENKEEKRGLPGEPT